MSFTGDIEVLRFDAVVRELELLGKGADKGGSSAAMKLFARLEPGEGGVDTCILLGDATVTVSGKLAQFGGRLLVPIADAMLAQFAKNFETAAAAVELAATAAPAAVPDAPLADAASAVPAAALEPVAVPAATSEAATPVLVAVAPVAVPTSTVILPQPRVVKTVAPAAAPANELNALTLAWAVLRGWFLGLFSKKTA